MSALRVADFLRTAGIFLFAIALPFNLWSVQAGLALALVGVLLRAFRSRELPALCADLAPPVALYLAAIALSWLGSGQPMPSFGAAFAFWPILAPFVLVAAIPDTRTLGRIWLCVGAMAALMGAYGAIQHFFGVDWFRIHTHIARPAPDSPGRFLAVGNFEAHTTYAFALAFPFLYATASLFGGLRSRALRAAHALAAAMMAAGIVVSYVRAIWLGMLVGLGIIALLRRGPVLKIAAVLIVVGSASVAAVPSLRARALSIVDPKYNAGRAYIWERSWQMLADHPTTGIGFGSYRALQDAYFDPKASPKVVPRTGAHSTYLHIAVESGALGLVAFLWIWIRTFRAGVRLWRRLAPDDAPARVALTGSLAGIGCFLFGSFFQESFFDGEVAFALWLAVASVYVVGRERGSPEQAPNR
jgi:O-antigen ligase